jgi:hypothetical protein
VTSDEGAAKVDMQTVMFLGVKIGNLPDVVARAKSVIYMHDK